jgi:hypothetical protein
MTAGPYRYLPVERTVARRNRPDRLERLFQGGPWKVSLRTLVTQSSHARNNLMSAYEWPGVLIARCAGLTLTWHRCCRSSLGSPRLRGCPPGSSCDLGWPGLGASCCGPGRRPPNLAIAGINSTNITVPASAQ